MPSRGEQSEIEELRRALADFSARLAVAEAQIEKNERKWYVEDADGDPPLFIRTIKAVKFAEGFELFVRMVNRGVLAVAAIIAAVALMWDRIVILFSRWGN